MALQQLASAAAAESWLRARVHGSLRSDSREVAAGDAFIAWPGAATDARRHVAQALQRGASACLVEAQGADAFGFDDSRIAALPGLKPACGEIASAWFGHPSRELDVVAVTGTNGKSSIAWWTAQALRALGRRCGLVGTLGVGEPPPAGGSEAAGLQSTGLTTPDPLTLQRALRDFADRGFAACAIEASSIGIEEHRLAGTRIAVAQFSNFTRDHLDYHGDMDAYWRAKRALFDWPGLRAAVVNTDDAKGEVLASELSARPTDAVWTCALHRPARLRGQRLRYDGGGLAFDLLEYGVAQPVASALIGDYNASNLLVVLATLRALGHALPAAASVVPGLTPVPGRLQRVAAAAAEPEVVVDYAHTPDALDKALAALRPLATARGGRLWCVFGCGGNRDASKRPLMGAVAGRGADEVVVTSDNPRLEDPQAIVAQVAAGLAGPAQALCIVERREAIAHAVASAGARDVVLLAGKGHEDYQDIGGIRRPFSDVDEARAALRARKVAA